MKTSTCRDGTLKNQPNKMGTTPQHFHTIPTSCASLPCVSSVHRRVIEGSGLGSAGCVGHVDVHALRVSCVVDCNCYCAWQDMVCLVRRSCVVHKQC